MILLQLSGIVAISFLSFITYKTGLFSRMILALGNTSLENIPYKAANKYGDKILFTCDVPSKWDIASLKEKYPDPLAWSANRLKTTTGLIGTMLQTKLGVGFGDRVAICKENHLDIHIMIMAITRAGAIACPIHGDFASKNIGGYLSKLHAETLIIDSKNLSRFYQEGDFGTIKNILIVDKESELNLKTSNIIEKIVNNNSLISIRFFNNLLEGIHTEILDVKWGYNDPIYLTHTSGTTGVPKAVILRRGPQSFAVKAWLLYVHLSRRYDKAYMAVPNNHQAVILTFNSSLLLGLPTHWSSHHDPKNFDAEYSAREIINGQFTAFFGFPNTYTKLKELDKSKYNFSNMRVWGTTADASHEAIISEFVQEGSVFKSLGIPIKGSVFLDAQGSSEVGTPSVLRLYSKFAKKFDRRIGKIGSAPLAPSIRIANKNGEEIPKGEVGRLEVKGKTVFNAYWNNHDLTMKCFHDNWFFTGDVAKIGEDGHIVQLDREVDVIQAKDHPIYSLPIEEVLHKHEAVFDICVYGYSQKDGSQLPAAAVSLRNGYHFSEKRLLEELNKCLASSQKLVSLEIIPWEKFPFGVTGKTLKRTFRDRSIESLRSAEPKNNNNPETASLIQLSA